VTALRPWLLFLVAGAWFLASGCGGSNNGSTAVLPDTVRVDLNDGLWQVTTTTIREDDPLRACAPAESTTVDTLGICSLVFLEGSIEPIGITCTAAQEDSTFNFACDLRRDLSPCTVTFHTEGSGIYERERYTLTSKRTSTVTGDPVCAFAYPEFADPCTLTVIEVGVFLDASYDSLRGCTDDAENTKAYLRRVGLDP